jgi:ABC-type nitrate/sulfonate/bicarbonate transport system substrate-binding protein
MGCQRQPPRIVLAVNPWPGYGYFALAKARSHYDVHRINLDLRNFADPAATMEAYISGGAQAIATTTIDAVAICGVAPDRCPVIVFVIDESRGADQVLVRQGVKDLKDLADQPIALDRSSLSRYVLSRAFESVGLPPPTAVPAAFPACRLLGSGLATGGGAGGGDLPTPERAAAACPADENAVHQPATPLRGSGCPRR